MNPSSNMITEGYKKKTYEQICELEENGGLNLVQLEKEMPEFYINILSKRANVQINIPSNDVKNTRDFIYEQAYNNLERIFVDKNDYLSNMIDPVSVEALLDPVVTNTGHTYEHSNILKWFTEREADNKKITNPLTNTELKNKELRPNILIKNIVHGFLCDNSIQEIAYNNFRCPLTGKYMIDPFIAEDGKTYEREALEWIKPEIYKNAIPNINVKSMIDDNQNKEIYGNNAYCKKLTERIINADFEEIQKIISNEEWLSLSLDRVNYIDAWKKLANLVCEKKESVDIVKLVIGELTNKLVPLQNVINNKTVDITLAAKNGYYEVVQLLLGQQIGRNTKKNGDALKAALKNDHNAVAQLFLEKGYPNEIVQLLLEKGYLNNNQAGDDPLIWSTKKGFYELIQLLLEYGIDPNIQDDAGNTPLMLVVLNERRKNIYNESWFLKKRGTESKDYNNNKEIIRLFLEKRADINIKNNCGECVISVIDNLNITDTEIKDMLMEEFLSEIKKINPLKTRMRQDYSL